MPNRILKESICTSDSVDSLGWFEEVLFYRLIVNCDDYGRFDGRPAVIKARLFPLKERLTVKDVSAALEKLAGAGIVRTYVCEGKPYLRLPTWQVHQSIRAKKSKYPAPPEEVEGQPENICVQPENICVQMNADVPVIQSNTESESESKCENTKLRAQAPSARDQNRRFLKPTREEIEAYCRENSYSLDAGRFLDYYEANGWHVGKNPMKDWRAAVRNWCRGNNYAPPGKKDVPKGASGTLGDAELEAIQRVLAENPPKEDEKCEYW